MGAAEARKVKRNKDGSVDAGEWLEAFDGPLTFARLVNSTRVGEEMSLSAFAKQLGVSAAHLCDIEKGRRTVSPERAARWATVLGYHPAVWVELALQAALDVAG